MKSKVFAVLFRSKNDAYILGNFKRYASATRAIRARAKQIAPKLELKSYSPMGFYFDSKKSSGLFEIHVLQVNP